jgi:hypothetical protein
VNDKLVLSASGVVLDPVDWRPYVGPVRVIVYPDRILVRALLDVPLEEMGYLPICALALPAPSGNGRHGGGGG